MANPNPSPETRFKPGNPGGPGRRKGSITLTGLLRAALQKADGDRTKADELIDAMLDHAIKGNASYMKEVWDRVEGKPAAAPDEAEPDPPATDADGNPIDA